MTGHHHYERSTTMTRRFIARQGDVLIIATDRIPAQTRPVARDHGRIVLAYGEVTGHAHAITDPAATLLELPDTEISTRFLQVLADGGVDLHHEEHATITLPPGTYEVRRQREYAPEASFFVAD